MAQTTITLTVCMNRLTDMCPTCWRSAMYSWHTVELKATGVEVGRDHIVCGACARD